MQPDVLIVGGGLAGLVAANRAAQVGLVPLVLEAREESAYACNSRICGGVFHVAHRSATRPAEVLRASIERVTYGNALPEAAGLLASRSAEVIRWMQREGIRYIRGGPEEYQTWVLAPPKPAQPGLEWKGRGGDVMMRTLERNLLARGHAIRRGTLVTELLEERGRCIGVRIRESGGCCDLRADAVVIADGGFQANLAMVERHISPAPERLLQRNAQTGLGDGIRMAEAMGAATIGMASFYGHLQSRDAMRDARMWPYPVIDHLAAAAIIVDCRGRRFTNEALGGVSIANAVARLDDPLSCTVIFDSAAWHGPPGRFRHTPPNPHLLSIGATMHVAGTLPELARRAALPARAMVATVEEFNGAVIEGRLHALAPTRTTAPVAPVPILRPPFHAIPVCAAISYTMGGVRIDAGCRVVDRRGAAIPGLYAAGATTGGLEGGPEAGYVGGLVQSAAHGLAVVDAILGDRDGRSHIATTAAGATQ
jgi:fumarate reductase flavoprotein subunit